MSWVADALVLLALTVMTVGVFGLQRMPDIYTQLHAASKAVFLGVITVLVAVAIGGDFAVLCRVLLISAALVLTTPISAHAVARTAFLLGARMAVPGSIDESGRDLPSAPASGDERRRPRRSGGRRVVVGYDGSEHAKRALERAADAAGRDGVVIVVAAGHVLPSSPQAAGAPEPDEREAHELVLAEARDRLAERGVTAQPIAALAYPAQAIIDTAREQDADLIVVGSRGRGGAARRLLGSVSGDVADRAEVPVEVV